MNQADRCRENGWGPGTMLVGDEGYGPTVIEVTAVGIERILARQISHNGVADTREEGMWTFQCRDWQEVSDG